MGSRCGTDRPFAAIHFPRSVFHAMHRAEVTLVPFSFSSYTKRLGCHKSMANAAHFSPLHVTSRLLEACRRRRSSRTAEGTSLCFRTGPDSTCTLLPTMMKG